MIPLVITIIILLGALGYYFAHNYKIGPGIPPSDFDWSKVSGEDKFLTISNGSTICYYNSKFFVITKDSDVIGKEFLIKKTTDSEKVPCDYTVATGDFELKLQATYFLALEKDFLILDSGTAPDPRGLSIYNLNSNREVYLGRYSKPISIEKNTITFWSPTEKIKPTTENCPSLEEYTASGLSAGIESKVVLNLLDMTIKELGEYRCSARQ